MKKNINAPLVLIMLILAPLIGISVAFNLVIPWTILIGGMVIVIITWKYPRLNLTFLTATVILISPIFGTQRQTSALASFFYNNLAGIVKLSPFELWILLSLVISLLKARSEAIRNILNNNLFYALTFFLFVCSYGLVLGVISGDFNDALREFRPILLLYMVFLLGSINLSGLSMQSITVYLNITFLFSLLKTLQGIIFFFFIRQGYYYQGMLRVFGGAELLFILWLFIYGLYSILVLKKKGTFAFLSIPAGIMWILSFSRAIWVGGIAALTVVFFHVAGQAKKAGRSIALLLSLILLVLIIFFAPNRVGEQIRSYVSTISFSSSEITTRYRILETLNALNNIKEQPILGYGLGYEVDLAREFREEGVPIQTNLSLVHNAYLWLWLKMGILGPVSFLIVYITSLLSAWRQAARSAMTLSRAEFITLGSTIAVITGLMVILVSGNWILNSRAMFFLGLTLSIQAGVTYTMTFRENL